MLLCKVGSVLPPEMPSSESAKSPSKTSGPTKTEMCKKCKRCQKMDNLCGNLVVEKQHGSTFVAQFLFTVYCEGERYLLTEIEIASIICKNLMLTG